MSLFVMEDIAFFSSFFVYTSGLASWMTWRGSLIDRNLKRSRFPYRTTSLTTEPDTERSPPVVQRCNQSAADNPPSVPCSSL